MRLVACTVLSIVILSSSLSGCLSSDEGDDSIIEIEEPSKAFTIVAPIDTGINVYHNHFIMNESIPDWIIEGMGVTIWCNITKEGTWQERYEADKENCWDIITSNDIVYFVGTRIIGTTPDDQTATCGYYHHFIRTNWFNPRSRNRGLNKGCSSRKQKDSHRCGR